MAGGDQRHRRRAADIAVRSGEEDSHPAFLLYSRRRGTVDASNRSRGAPKRPSFAKSLSRISPNKRGVQRREAPGSWAAPRGRMLPLARASGAARATGRSACANRLLRARCASRRSTRGSCRGGRPPRLKNRTRRSFGLASGRRALAVRDFDSPHHVLNSVTIVKSGPLTSDGDVSRRNKPPILGFAELVIGPATSGRTRWLNPATTPCRRSKYRCHPDRPGSSSRSRRSRPCISRPALPSA